MERVVISSDERGSASHSEIWEKVREVLEATGTRTARTNVVIGAMVRSLFGLGHDPAIEGMPMPMPIGTVDGIVIEVDPRMEFEDTRVIGSGVEIIITMDAIDLV